MKSFDYTISIGHVGEQLTLNQWVLGSSPRGMGKEAERAGGRDVPTIQPYGKRKALFLLL